MDDSAALPPPKDPEKQDEGGLWVFVSRFVSGEKDDVRAVMTTIVALGFLLFVVQDLY